MLKTTLGGSKAIRTFAKNSTLICFEKPHSQLLVYSGPIHHICLIGRDALAGSDPPFGGGPPKVLREVHDRVAAIQLEGVFHFVQTSPVASSRKSMIPGGRHAAGVAGPKVAVPVPTSSWADVVQHAHITHFHL